MRVGFFRRIAAFIIDLAFFLTISNASAIFYPEIRAASESGQYLISMCIFTSDILGPMMCSSACQTIGMGILRIGIRNETDLPKWYFLIRYYLYWIMFSVFFVFIIFNRQRLTLYDYMAGSRYYLIPKNQPEPELD